MEVTIIDKIDGFVPFLRSDPVILSAGQVKERAVVIDGKTPANLPLRISKYRRR